MTWALVFVTLFGTAQAKAEVVSVHASMFKCFEARELIKPKKDQAERWVCIQT